MQLLKLTYADNLTLLRKYQIDIDSYCWTRIFATKISYVKQIKRSSKYGEVCEKNEFLLTNDILKKIEKYKIPSTLIIIFNQTPLKYVSG